MAVFNGALPTPINQNSAPKIREILDVPSNQEMEDSIAQSTASAKTKTMIVNLSGITTNNHRETNFAASRNITPGNVLSVMIRSDSGYSQTPIVAYYNAAQDSCYIRSTATPNNGTVSLLVAYLA